MSTEIERQRKFRDKMYEAGFKQTIIWVKRKEVKYIKNMKRIDFTKRLERITSGWNDRNLSELYNLFIKIASAKKEVIRLRRTE
jgi:hypothetical protein